MVSWGQDAGPPGRLGRPGREENESTAHLRFLRTELWEAMCFVVRGWPSLSPQLEPELPGPFQTSLTLASCKIVHSLQTLLPHPLGRSLSPSTSASSPAHSPCIRNECKSKSGVGVTVVVPDGRAECVVSG